MVGWPLRRVLDPRVRMTVHEIDARLGSEDLRRPTVHDRLDDLDRMGRDMLAGLGWREVPEPGGSLAQLDAHRAAYLNWANGPDGYASQAGMWFDPPVPVHHDAGAVEVRVVIDVRAVQDPPSAADDRATTVLNVPLGIVASQLLANDSDPDGDALSGSQVSGDAGTHGTVAIANGTVTYAPARGFAGDAPFAYTISDGHGNTDNATVNVTLQPGHDPSVAHDDTAATREDQPLAVAVAELLANDSDPHDDAVPRPRTTAGRHRTMRPREPANPPPNSTRLKKPAKAQATQAVEPVSLGAETCSTTCKSPPMETAGIEPASAIA